MKIKKTRKRRRKTRRGEMSLLIEVMRVRSMMKMLLINPSLLNQQKKRMMKRRLRLRAR